MASRFFLAMALLACTSCDAVKSSCWNRLDELYDEFYPMLDTTTEVNAAALDDLRSRMSASIRQCGEDEPFVKELHVSAGGPVAYYTLLDFAIMANDTELTAALYRRQQQDLSAEFVRDSLTLGGTHLATAIYTESDRVVEWLIASGWDANEIDDMGASALHFSYARTDSGLRITRDLVASGADIELRANNGMTPLDAAWRRGDLRKAQCLVALGARVPEDIDADENDLSPLVDLAEYQAVADFLRSPDRAVPDDIGSLCTR